MKPNWLRIRTALCMAVFCCFFAYAVIDTARELRAGVLTLDVCRVCENGG